MRFKHWLIENTLDDLHSKASKTGNQADWDAYGNAALKQNASQQKVTPDSLYSDASFPFALLKNNTLVVGDQGTKHNQNTMRGYGSDAFIDSSLGRVEMKSGFSGYLPVVAFWSASPPEMKTALTQLIELGKIRPGNPVTNKGDYVGTVQDTINGKTQKQTIEIFNVNGVDKPLHSIISDIHSLPRASQEFKQLEKWICNNKDKHREFSNLVKRLKCNSPQTINPFGFSTFDQWLKNNPDARNREIKRVEKYYQ